MRALARIKGMTSFMQDTPLSEILHSLVYKKEDTLSIMSTGSISTQQAAQNITKTSYWKECTSK